MSSKSQSDKPKKVFKTRNWYTLVYPESAPKNWLTILEELNIPCFVSPLHDKDIDEDNKPKKPHHHVVLMFDGPVTKENAQEICKKIGGVGLDACKSLRGYCRYLCHLDSPHKAQYNVSDVLAFGGASYMFQIGTMQDKNTACREMRAFIKENDVTCFADLYDYADLNNDSWFDALNNSCAYVIKEYIKSYTWKYHHIEEK